MPKLRHLAALAAASAALGASSPALAAPATVNLRLEGKTQTLFEGPITTDAKTLTKDGSGAHPCDGTNGGHQPSPGPTMTGAMDDGINAADLTWTASWNDGFQDFFINSVGPDVNETAPPYTYWGFFQNWVSSQNGGCQERVQQGDEILVAYSEFGQPLLQLSGAPSRAATGESFQVTVQSNDGSGTRTPATGATVQGQTTDAAGHAMIAFGDAGIHKFKATQTGSVRSNAAMVCVYAPGSGDCGTEKAGGGDAGGQTPTGPTPQPEPAAPAAKDTTPPAVRVTSLEDGKAYTKGPRELSGTVDDAGGIVEVFLRIRATNGGDLTSASRCRWFSGKRSVFTHRTVPCSKARFFRIGNAAKFSYLLPARLRTGKYALDVKVLDRAYNAGRSSVAFRVK
jgi:hypothetical protein